MGKTPEDAAQIIGSLLAKSTTKKRGDDGFLLNIEEKRVEILNFPSTGDEIMLNHILSTIDPHLEAEQIAHAARFTRPLELETGNLSRIIKATLTTMRPTARFIEWVKGEWNTGDPLIDNLIVRRNFTPEDDDNDPIYATLLVESRTKAMRALLDIGVLCGLTRFQMETLIKNDMQDSVDNQLWRQKFEAVHIDEVFVEATKSTRMPRQIPYNNEKARMRVHMRGQDVAALMLGSSMVPSITLGKGPGALVVEVSMKLFKKKASLDSKRMSEVRQKEAECMQMASRYAPARDIHRVEGKFKYTVHPEKYPKLKDLAISDIAEAIRSDLGGLELSGIVGVHIPSDHTNRPDLDGRQVCTFWFMDKSKRTDAPTETHARFVRRLAKGTVLHAHEWLTGIHLRGETTTTFVRPASALAEEPIRPLSKDQTNKRIENHLALVGPAYLHAKTMNDTDVVFPNKKGQRATTWSEFGPVGEPDIDDDIVRTDIRALFREEEVTAEQLMECLQDLAVEGVLILYDPEPDRRTPDGRPAYTIYGAFNDVFTAERVVDSDADEDLDQDGNGGDSAGDKRDDAMHDGNAGNGDGNDRLGPGNSQENNPADGNRAAHATGNAMGDRSNSAAGDGLASRRDGRAAESAQSMEVEGPARTAPGTAAPRDGDRPHQQTRARGGATSAGRGWRLAGLAPNVLLLFCLGLASNTAHSLPIPKTPLPPYVSRDIAALTLGGRLGNNENNGIIRPAVYGAKLSESMIDHRMDPAWPNHHPIPP